MQSASLTSSGLITPQLEGKCLLPAFLDGKSLDEARELREAGTQKCRANLGTAFNAGNLHCGVSSVVRTQNSRKLRREEWVLRVALMCVHAILSQGKTFAEVRRSYSDCVILGHKRGPTISIDMSDGVALAPGDQLVMLSYNGRCER